jgi:hypothetical protein
VIPELVSQAAVWPAARPGSLPGMFVWTKRSGERGKARFYWWPLVLGLVLSVLLTLALNAR